LAGGGGALLELTDALKKSINLLQFQLHDRKTPAVMSLKEINCIAAKIYSEYFP